MPQFANPRRWTYGPDGNSATRELDGAKAILLGEIPSTRERPRYQFGPDDWQPFLTTLRFLVKTNRFAVEFCIERQNVVSNRALAHDHDYYFNVIWTLDYDTVQLEVDGIQPVPVSAAEYVDWLEFDMLLLGLLGDWPRPEEDRWVKTGHRSSRVTYALGGWTGGRWDAELIRTRETTYFSYHWPDLSGHFHRSIASSPDIHGWERTAHALGIVNARTGDCLTFREHFTSSGKFPRTFGIFQYQSPDFDLPLPVKLPSGEYSHGLWRVDLWYAPLMAQGWDLDRMLALGRTDEQRQIMDKALEELEPKDAMQAAKLANGVVDAVLHWQAIDGIESPRAIKLAGVSNRYAYWPYDYLNASL